MTAKLPRHKQHSVMLMLHYADLQENMDYIRIILWTETPTTTSHSQMRFYSHNEYFAMLCGVGLFF